MSAKSLRGAYARRKRVGLLPLLRGLIRGIYAGDGRSMRRHCPDWRNSGIRSHLVGLRYHSGLSIDAIATESGYAANYIGAVLRGYATPSIKALNDIATAMGYRMCLVSETQYRKVSRRAVGVTHVS